MVPTPHTLGRPRAGSLVDFAGLKSSSLLRGLPLQIALQRLGLLFSTSTTSAPQATSEPSEPPSTRSSSIKTSKSSSVKTIKTGASSPQYYYINSIKTDHLQDFISHNWVTSRTEKFLCLALRYNLNLAICASWGVAALCGVLALGGVLPAVVATPNGLVCYACCLSGQVAFLLAFLGAQDFWRLLGRLGLAGHGRLLFVDKACINQVDPALKREGIESLAGFLIASQNIVVVYGPEYLYKLWTVYEIATFVMAHQDHTRIKVLPTMWLRQHGAFFIGLALAHLLYYMLRHFWVAPGTGLAAFLIPAALFCALGGYFIRQWQLQLADITAAIEVFSIRKTKCAVESDRTQVQENVRAFMFSLGRVSAESTEDALDEFDKLVREVLPRALVESIGPTGTPYLHLIACSSVFMGDALDNLILRIRLGSPWWVALSAVLFNASGCLTLIPLAAFLVQKILARRLHLRGCAEGLLIAAALVPAMGIYFIPYYLDSLTMQLAGRAAGAYCSVALLLYCALAAVVTVAVYAPKRPSRLCRDDPPAAGMAAEDAQMVPLTPPIPQTSQWRARRFSVDEGETVASGNESELSI